ncbi:hypothetical protein [Streptomyces bobili]|uniref:hypothetical protein n=1 Tax=Streptomyces bobili TaxID=67280 RepID=UPI00371B3DF0
MRELFNANADNGSFYPIMILGGVDKAHQELSFVHGHATALLLNQDVEGALKQRRLLQKMAGAALPRTAVARAEKPADAATAAGDTKREHPTPPSLSFPPVTNGIDYLRSVVDSLTLNPEPRPRDLKYAVLHLYAATEVLLKVRLSQEHWSLVWAEPKKATIKQRDTRTFQSCGADEAIERLGDILDIRVSNDSVKAIKRLSKQRNQLQHDGLIQSTLAIEAQSAEVLDFLLAFIHQHLVRYVDISDTAELETIREKVVGIKAFVAKREERLRRDLDPALTVQCPHCDKWALALNGSGVGTVTCHFCDITAEAWNIALDYAEAMPLLPDYTSLLGSGDRPVLACAGCPENALVAGAITLAEYQATTKVATEHEAQGGSGSSGPSSSDNAPALRYLCFACTSSWASTALATCSYCGMPFVPDDEEPLVCSECAGVAYHSF